MNSLPHLLNSFNGGCYAVIAAGPSLDLCTAEIEALIECESVFFITDAVADQFLRAHPRANHLIVTAESRPHNFLCRIKNKNIAVYKEARYGNVPKKNKIYRFNLVGEAADKTEGIHLTSLVSPGTVGGLALSLALFSAKLQSRASEISIFGLDLAYLDNRVFSRYCVPWLYQETRLRKRASNEFVTILKKTSSIRMIQDYAIRMSDEMVSAKKGIETLLSTLPANIVVIDYSPAGVQPRVAHERPVAGLQPPESNVIKAMPSSLKTH